MSYRADLSVDMPSAHQPKRIIFYARGLKIYGLIPYLLKQYMQAEFFSNYYVSDSGPFRGHGIVSATGEQNYTVVRYHQSMPNCQRLLRWLYSDAGFEWAIAGPSNFNDNIWSPNVANWPPEVWSIGQDGYRELFSQVIRANQGCEEMAIEPLRLLAKQTRSRCDHCQKFISEKHQTGVYTLEGLVSLGVDINFCICEKCIDKNYSTQYWDAWAKKQASPKLL